jgi:hypothetical protein
LKAYELALGHTDDIYLLRLIIQTGPVLSQLTDSIGKKVLMRINEINRGGSIQNILIEWIADDK